MIMNCVIVGLDDSPGSRAAHCWAAAYAEATGTDLCAVHVLNWPVGLSASAVKSSTRLYVPKQDVAEPYWRGLHRVYHDISSPRKSALRSPKAMSVRYWCVSARTRVSWSSAAARRSQAARTCMARSVDTASATPAARSSRFRSHLHR